MASDFNNQYGNKFTDGIRTLKYSKTSEAVIVNSFDILSNKVNSLETKFDNNIGQLRSDINTLGNETAKMVNEVRDTFNMDIRVLNAHKDATQIRLNTLLIVIYNVMNIWPLRFLNRIFKWWTYEIIQESRTDEDTYIFYVYFILRGPKKRKEQIEYEKRFKNRIKTVKKLYKEKNIKLKYLVKPYFSDIVIR